MINSNAYGGQNPALSLQERQARVLFNKQNFTSLMSEIKKSPEEATKAHSQNVDSLEIYTKTVLALITPPSEEEATA